MKIALVAPSAVPFTPGGAERLWWGLAAYVNRHTPHAMELIKLPSPERDLWEIVRSYRAFAALDLDHFDLVLSTKYPAWMVAHGNHVVYLQHKLRGLYDTYPAELPTALPELPPAAAALGPLLGRTDLDRAALPELFGLLDALHADRASSAEAKAKLVAFPGPFARAVVHALDRIGLAPRAVRRYAAISRTVREREGYFPPGATVAVVPHPPDIADFREAPGEFVFTASRLDGAKRVDLLIRAYRRCSTGTPLVVAGEGPAERALRELAGGDPRIRFVGRLSDEALLAHYARAHFVVFVPYDEDMGLVTLEAMKSAKPVLTVSDAGGVCEFVKDGVNGRVVQPDADALAAAIDALMADPERRQAMGNAARATGATVTWQRTVDTLLERSIGTRDDSAGDEGTAVPWAPRAPGEPARPRILVLNTFAVYPPDSGGKKRIYHLFDALSRRADVTLLNLGNAGERSEWREFGERFREIRIPPDERFQADDAALHRLLRASVTDITALLRAHAMPQFVASFKALAANADVVVASHLYLAPLIQRHWQGELWYDAHNVEADMKADILGVPRPRAPIAATDAASAGRVGAVTDAAQALSSVVGAEAALVRAAARVLAASDDDAARFAELYGRARESIESAPNGVALPDDPWLDASRRAALKASLGFDGTPLALFVGSHHGPNVEAADIVIDAARASPRWTFLVAGSICDYPRLRAAGDAVRCLGVVSEPELTALFRAADVGLNPMRRGSGTNLKMLDYAAHGALALSTEVGARGLGFVAGTHYLSFADDALAEALAALTAELPSPRPAMRAAARAHVEAGFSWRAIAEKITLPARGP